MSEPKENARLEIGKLIAEATAALKLAEELAIEHDVTFSIEVAENAGLLFDSSYNVWEQTYKDDQVNWSSSNC